MRVTQNMMINNAIRWMSQQTDKLNDISTVVATGKQVNKPSDDPSATGQILGDRATISHYAKYIANISEANSWIEVSNSTLESINSMLETAQDIIESDDSWDSDTGASYLEQLKSIYDQVVDLANTQFNSVYLYGGNNSLTTPYADEVEISGGIASNVVFGLAENASQVTIEITDSSGNVVRTLNVSSGGTEGDNSVVWDGLDDDGNPLADGTYDFTVHSMDSLGDAVASYAAYRGNGGGREVIIGQSTVTLYNDGSIFSEALRSLSQAITALENSTYTDTLTSDLSASIESSIEKITSEQVTLSTVSSQLEYADTRLDSLTLTLEDEISTLEAGDTEEAAVKLEAQTTAHEVTLEAVSDILKMGKLSDYV